MRSLLEPGRNRRLIAAPLVWAILYAGCSRRADPTARSPGIMFESNRVPARANRDQTFWDPLELELDRAVLARRRLPGLERQLEIDRNALTQLRNAVAA